MAKSKKEETNKKKEEEKEVKAAKKAEEKKKEDKKKKETSSKKKEVEVEEVEEKDEKEEEKAEEKEDKKKKATSSKNKEVEAEEVEEKEEKEESEEAEEEEKEEEEEVEEAKEEAEEVEEEEREEEEEKKEAKKPKKDPSEATSMEELLELTGHTINTFKPGEVVDGTVSDISRKMVTIDIGAKTEGIVVDKEFEAASDFINELDPGDEVSVYVLTPENERGQILLSLKRALMDRKWQQFAEYLETGEAVEVKGLETNKGGMIVYAEGLRGFVPSSQFGKDYLGQMDKLLDEQFKVKVIEVDKDKNRLIFSEKLVSEAEAIAMKSKALDAVTVGDTYEGVVSGIMPFGVFVGVEVPLESEDDADAGKLEGLVHISEISWEKVNDPNDYFKLGDRVEVKVIDIDEEAGKLNLSVKQLKDDPWDEIVEKYPVGSKVNGEITRIAPFGAFVTLEPGVDGLIHISKIPAGEEPQSGQEVEVFVESVDPEQRRMSLGMVLTEVPMGYK